MNINNTDNCHRTLRSLLEEFRIEIPILQREYAQGRREEERVRKDFVAYLADSLTERKAIHLDFVYGSLREDKTEGEPRSTLIPLDGQQRLTTLWLLHWFLAVKEGRVAEISEVLKGFCYEARPAAMDFCHCLLTKDFSDLDFACFKEKMRNYMWFVENWDSDATVSGMLTMLETFSQTPTLLDKSVTLDLLWEHGLISFCFLNLEDFELTEDLYIRMNARGEKLTSFEHFKSHFYTIIQGHEKTKEIKEKMEKEWVEALWDYRGDKYTIDAPFLNFLHFLNRMTYFEARKKGEGRKEMEDESDFCDLSFIRHFYDPTHNSEHIHFLVFALDTLAFLKEVEYPGLLKADRSFRNLLKSIIEKKETASNHCVILYAALLYKQAHPDTESNASAFLDFLRIVRNLIVNTRDKSTREWERILPTIREFAQQEHPYEVLRNEDWKFVGFREDQIREERFKARLFARQPEAKSLVQPMEDHVELLGFLQHLICVTMPEEKSLEDINVDEFDLATMRNVFEAYEHIYKYDKTFDIIWGDLLISSMYRENQWRVTWKQDGYTQHRSIFELAARYASHRHLDLDDFLVLFEKQEVRGIAEKTASLSDFSVCRHPRKKQLFLLYVISRRLMGKSKEKFFNKGYNFGWLDEKYDYPSVFAPKEGDAPIVFQSYESRFRYNSGINRAALTPPEREKDVARRTAFLTELLNWANS